MKSMKIEASFEGSKSVALWKIQGEGKLKHLLQQMVYLGLHLHRTDADPLHFCDIYTKR